MALDRKKLINLRNNIQAYLMKVEREDKLGNLDTIVAENTERAVQTAFGQLQDQLEAVPDERQDLTEILEALTERMVGATPKDRTDEIVTAISNIRFPEVNLPNHISVDNFPPQKIPNPVTNVKSTIVADDTGLLQAIVDALGGASNADIISQYGEQTVAAGNTLVLATYTVPTAKVLNVSGLYGDGINNGIFKLYVGGAKVWQGRNAWTDRNVQSYLIYIATAGQVVELKVTNNVTSSTLYTGGFYGRQIDA
jgi:hypothetical protein